ncbi:MAG TPA: Flp family type IVb pilin [Gemmatimonadaceae bacterium]
MSRITMLVRHFVKNDEAATMVEYGIMLALIAAICVGVITALGQNVLAGFTNTNNALPG